MTEEDNEVPQRQVPDLFFPHQVPKSPHQLACRVGTGWPPCPQARTFDAADDFEAAGGEPVGDEQQDGDQGGIEQAVVVQGCPLHGSIPSTPSPAPARYLGQPYPGSPPATAGREAGAQAGNWGRRVRARLPNQLP